MKYLSIFFIAFLISCKPSDPKFTAQQIIDKTILYSGADKVANSEISFKFRDKEYFAYRENGNFKLIRKFDFIIDDQRLYCMKSNDIVIKYEYQGNEVENNPSWAKSS